MKYVKAGGIILGYLWMIPAHYWLHWNFNLLLFTFAFELCALLLVYIFVLSQAIYADPRAYRGRYALDVFFGAGPMLIMIFSGIGWVSNMVDPTVHFFGELSFFHASQTLWTIGGILVSYFLGVLSVNTHARESVYRTQLIYQAGILLVIVVVGIISVFPAERAGLLNELWIGLIGLRVIAETYYALRKG